MKKFQEEQVMNEEVRRRFGNILPIEVFITRRTWRYNRRIVREDQPCIHTKEATRSSDTSTKKSRKTSKLKQE